MDQLLTGSPETSARLWADCLRFSNSYPSNSCSDYRSVSGNRTICTPVWWSLPGELAHPAQATHDLGVSAVWLHLAVHTPHRAMAWVGEDLLAHTRSGQKCPDAFIIDETNAVQNVIEFGGDYDRERIQSFHDDCVERVLPYQMW